MGPLARCALLAGVMLVAGCGSSVADEDGRRPIATTRAAASPFCAAAQANSDAIRALSTAPDGRVAPVAIDTARRTGTEFRAAAPDEIRADVDRSVRAVDLQLDALLANGGNVKTLTDDPQLAERLRAPEFAGAPQRVTAYVGRACR